MDKIKPEEKVCYNCKYLAWLVALGQGLKCTHSKNRKDNSCAEVKHRRHTCELFEFNIKS